MSAGGQTSESLVWFWVGLVRQEGARWRDWAAVIGLFSLYRLPCVQEELARLLLQEHTGVRCRVRF